LSTLALASFCTLACPQAYPVRPVRLVIGSFPGGGNDLAGRIIAQNMQPKNATNRGPCRRPT